MRKTVADLFTSLDGVVEAPERWHLRYADGSNGTALELIDSRRPGTGVLSLTHGPADA
jgi:hypothetical protein